MYEEIVQDISGQIDLHYQSQKKIISATSKHRTGSSSECWTQMEHHRFDFQF